MAGLEAVLRSYLDHLNVERGVSPHTLAAYRRDLRRYLEYAAGRGITEPDQVTAAVLNDYAASLTEGVRDPDGGWSRRPLAGASAARAVVAVRSLHRFALDEGSSAGDPAAGVKPPKAPRRLPKALSVGQVQAILDVPDRDTELGLRDLGLLELLYGTGARVTEAVSLDVDDVSKALAAGPSGPSPGVRVLGKGSKQRILPLGSYARAALEAYLVRSRPVLASRGRGTPALFLNSRGGRLSRQSAWTVLATSAAAAGIAVDVSPHTLRHSFATHLLDGGADVRVVQELLGHASVTTTQIYTLVTVDHLREVYLSSHPRAY